VAIDYGWRRMYVEDMVIIKEKDNIMKKTEIQEIGNPTVILMKCL
jgi:hypothetical protein